MLIIFDNDGVLVDSEPIACRVELEVLRGLGHPIGAEEFHRRAIGTRAADCRAMLEAHWGRPLPADYGGRVEAALFAAFRRELRPVAGIAALLARLAAPRCVASSGTPERIALALEVTGLAPFFDGVFSGVEVPRGKPAPDLFLHAAERLGIPPGSAIVIEDSVPGIRAAKAAGMRAIGFTAGGHCGAGHAARLTEAGADAIAPDAMALARLLGVEADTDQCAAANRG
jgi:HAD superfamily hydrolase (TIGR01509 family)